MTKVSVLIPVHNTADYLEKCLESVRGQTLGDIEILCVNDGSTDRSPELLRQAAREDARIRLTDWQDCRGVSAARNFALDNAIGEYIYFIDSDDWLDEDYLEAMVERSDALRADILMNTSYVQEYPDTGKRAFSSFDNFSSEGRFEPSAKIQRLLPPIIWARLYRRSFLQRHFLRFPPVKGGGEDIYFTGAGDLLLPEIFVFKGPYYHYLQRADSVAHQREKGFHYIENFRLLYLFLQEKQIPLDGVKLFFIESLVLDSEVKFNFVKAYLTEIADIARRNREIYNDLEWFLLDLMQNTPDYDAFRSRCHPDISMNFLRHRMRQRT